MLRCQRFPKSNKVLSISHKNGITLGVADFRDHLLFSCNRPAT